MATDYAQAVRNGAMEAARLHVQLNSEEAMQQCGGNVDVFAAAVAANLLLLLKPLKGLLGAYIPDPGPGALVTTERPFAIQRFTAAHELGHFRLDHLPSLDDENVLRRMALPAARVAGGPNFQEVEADAFAVAFMMPLWLIHWHCRRQGWLAHDLATPSIAYQLALRLGASYEAMTWTLQRYNLVSASTGNALRQTQPRKLKVELLRDYRPADYRGDVWLLTERDAHTKIAGSRTDHFVLRLNERSGGGYLWNIDQLKASGFAVVQDGRESDDPEGIGGHVVRYVTAAPEQGQRGEISIDECRPWQPNSPIGHVWFEYDFTGPEEAGLSRAAQRHILEAA
jgi:Zn-dependent peptidase ImmA (M78 family)